MFCLVSTSSYPYSSTKWSLRFGLWCSNACQSQRCSRTRWWHGRCCNGMRVLWKHSHTFSKPSSGLGNKGHFFTSTIHSSSIGWPHSHSWFGLCSNNACQTQRCSRTRWWRGRCGDGVRVLSNCAYTFSKPPTGAGNNDLPCFRLN
jgi:hypothetical protein